MENKIEDIKFSYFLSVNIARDKKLAGFFRNQDRYISHNPYVELKRKIQTRCYLFFEENSVMYNFVN